MASIRGGVVAKVVIGSTRPRSFGGGTSVGMFGGQAYGKMGESLYVYIYIYHTYIYICIHIYIYTYTLCL